MAWVRMTGGGSKNGKNLLKGQWNVTYYNNTMNTSNVFTDTLVSMTVTSASTTSNANAWAWLNSPIFDITNVQKIILRGSTYRTNANTNEAYTPRVYLVNASTGSKTQIYVQPSNAQNTGGTISVSYNTTSLTGDYYLQGELRGYGNTTSVMSAGAYIKITEASLQK